MSLLFEKESNATSDWLRHAPEANEDLLLYVPPFLFFCAFVFSFPCLSPPSGDAGVAFAGSFLPRACLFVFCSFFVLFGRRCGFFVRSLLGAGCRESYRRPLRPGEDDRRKPEGGEGVGGWPVAAAAAAAGVPSNHKSILPIGIYCAVLYPLYSIAPVRSHSQAVDRKVTCFGLSPVVPLPLVVGFTPVSCGTTSPYFCSSCFSSSSSSVS